MYYILSTPAHIRMNYNDKSSKLPFKFYLRIISNAKTEPILNKTLGGNLFNCKRLNFSPRNELH